MRAQTPFKVTSSRPSRILYLVLISAFYLKALGIAAHGFTSKLRMSRSRRAPASISSWFALVLSVLWTLVMYVARGLRLLATKLLNAGLVILVRSAKLLLRFAAVVRGKIARVLRRSSRIAAQVEHLHTRI